MKEKDLRIGNIIKPSGKSTHEKDFGIVSEIKHTHVRFNGIGSDHKLIDCIPIAITEEILLKCKMNRHEYDFCEYLTFLIGKIMFSISNEQLTIETENLEQITLPLPKYLHQFQNLIFALTGQELEVNM